MAILETSEALKRVPLAGALAVEDNHFYEARQPERGERMQKWEYMTCAESYNNGKWGVWSVNRATATGVEITRFLLESGDQGWELISATTETDNRTLQYCYRYIFKRPKA